jgi:O-acetyl-ADP-ribose deacetylase (regulator of RNase III)
MTKTRQTYRFGESVVNVEFGDIVEAEAQVIVSSDDTELSMRGQGVAAALRRAAGETIVAEAKAKLPAELGRIVVTSAGKMPHVQYIFHAVTRVFRAPPMEDRAVQTSTIEGATRRSLRLLRQMELRSIAFPALGTGFANFDPADVAIAMGKVIVEDLTRSASPITVTIRLLPEAMGRDVSFRDFFNRFDASTGMVHKVVRDHAVVMIHGIRTDGSWVDTIERVLKEGDHQLYPVVEGYGYFDLIRFLLPSRRIRNRVVTKIKARIDNLRTNQPDITKVSVIAHSFGTFLIGEMLRTDKDFRLHRLLLCGSILPADYPWDECIGQLDPFKDPDHPTRRVVNDCGWRDFWPVFAESVTWGYGSAGRFGFATQYVRDRYHKLGHSGFFTEEFAKAFWLPALSDGLFAAGPEGRPKSPWLLQLLTVFKLRYGIVLALAVLIPWLIFWLIL